MELSGKRAVVTGASEGIGREVARLLAGRGATVVAAARSFDRGCFASERVTAAEFDLRTPGQIDALIGLAARQMGGVDLFVANAGIGYYGKTAADWSRMEDIFRLNVFSPIYSVTKLCEAFPGRPLRFVAMDSGAGRIPLPGYSLYCATKFALDGFTRAFRFEMPENVTLSVVFPVSFDSNFFDKAAEGAPAPRPVVSLTATARKIVEGIERDRDEIYPSKVFPLLGAVNRFCPPIEGAYQRSERKRLDNWLRSHPQADNPPES